jgi:hypothetical protein
MAQERLTMRKIIEVLRLKWECGQTDRAIARSCSISHSTVAEYLRRTQEAGLSWPLPADMTEDRLYELLFPKAPKPGSRVIPCPDWSWVHTELRKKSVTLRLLWVEYREAHPDGYRYSQFCTLYRDWAAPLNPSMLSWPKTVIRSKTRPPSQNNPFGKASRGRIDERCVDFGTVLFPPKCQFTSAREYTSGWLRAVGKRDSVGSHLRQGRTVLPTLRQREGPGANGCSPTIVVMQAAEDRLGDDLPPGQKE